METRIVRIACSDCGYEWQQPDIKDITACPKCGGTDLVDPETDEILKEGFAKAGPE